MEPAQLMICEEWESLSGQYTSEESDFMTQFLSGIPSYFPSNVAPNINNSMCFSQGSSNSNSNDSGTFSCDLATNIDSSLAMFFCMEDAKFSPKLDYNIDDHEGSCLEPVKLVSAVENNLKAETEHEMMMVSEHSSDEDRCKNMVNPAKRFRSSIEVSKNMRNVRKCTKSTSMSTNEEGLMWHGSVSNNCFSHVDSNVCVELNGGPSSSLSPKEHETSNLFRKSKGTNGPATDAQSIYAKKRRERINERLRILQTLVPNGTKVDISTMLEEAVQYVKFLQLQIKVLSSDDKWMYAPIAYNGMNIGLDINLYSSTN